MKQQIDRLGIETWISNKAVNLIENGLLYDGFKYETDQYAIVVYKIENKHTVLARVYIENQGWVFGEIII